MNKLLIVLLAVCLVSVHAFVKRDVETEKKTVDDIAKSLQDITKQLNEQVSKVLDPEQIKKGFNDLVDKFSQGINDFKSTSEAPKE